jgi:diguanylate cyclase (GGDEF)-like protein
MDVSSVVTQYLHENVGPMLHAGQPHESPETGGWMVPVRCTVAGETREIGLVHVSAEGQVDPQDVVPIMDQLSDLMPPRAGEDGETAEEHEGEIMASLAGLLDSVMGGGGGLPRRDELTGVYNHASFQERLDEEVERALRYRLPFSLMFVDVDRFGAFNTARGYPLGDALLRQVARLLSRVLRGTDFVARWGNDEFVVIAQGPSSDTVRAAERLRATIAAHEFRVREGEPPVPVTVSVGAAAFPTAETQDRQALLHLAQDMLIAAKAAGGNRVMIAHGEPVTGGEGER